MQIHEVFNEAIVKGTKNIAPPKTATPPVSIGGQSIPPTDPLYQKIMQAPGAAPAAKKRSRKPAAGTAPARQRDPKTGRYVGKSNNAFANMAQQLAPQNTTAAAPTPAQPTTSSTGGTTQQTLTGTVHQASATNPNQPQQPQAQAPAPAAPPAKTGVKWGAIGKALGAHAIAGLGNAIRRNAPYGHYDNDDLTNRIAQSRTGVKAAQLTPQQIAMIRPTGDYKLDQYLKALGFFPQQGTKP